MSEKEIKWQKSHLIYTVLRYTADRFVIYCQNTNIILYWILYYIKFIQIMHTLFTVDQCRPTADTFPLLSSA